MNGRFVSKRRSSDVSVLLRCANATRGTAFGIAESTDVNVQLSKFANESAPVHSQYSGGFALIPVDLAKNDKNKLFFKFFQRFVILDACFVHSPHQCLKLGLCGIRMSSTHVQPGEALASLRNEICSSLCGAG
jgi:hypothetical protein